MAVCGLAVPSAAISTVPPSRFSLTVSPARMVVPANAPAVVRTVVVSNTGTEPLRVTVTDLAFRQAPDGAVSFTDRAPYSAASWVTATPAAFALPPGRRQPVQLHFTVPTDPEPGDHHAGVVFLVPAATGAANLAINRGVATEVFIGVPGAVERSSALGRLRAPRLADGGPVRLTLPVHNRGNVHRDYISPGRLVADTGGTRVPFPDFTVLRNSTRVVSTDWSPPLACVCHLRVVSDDGRGHRLVAAATVVVFPFRLVFGLVVLVVGLALLSRGLRRRSRRTTHARVEAARQEAYERASRDLAATPAGDSQLSIEDRS